jgi:hypothetical protein
MPKIVAYTNAGFGDGVPMLGATGRFADTPFTSLFPNNRTVQPNNG